MADTPDPRATFFDGVSEREYSQFVAKETVPAVYVDGVPTSWRTDAYTARYKEQVFRFEGLTDSQAHDTSAVTVTDVAGAQYTITPATSITDGSSGSASFEQEVVEVDREHMSPHLWRMIVTRRGGQLFRNGTSIVSPPAWTGWSSG